MRSTAIAAAAAVTTLGWLTGAGTAAASPEQAPSLAEYKAVSVDPYLDSTANGGEVYFQTPDGLLCAIRPAQGRAGCDGALPGARAAVNEIVLTTDTAARGLRATPTPAFVKPTGGAAPVLPAGSKITYADFECGAGDDGVTLCTKGSPVAAWMRISPDGTGVGPGTPGLPAGVPDPVDYIGSDDNYLVGNGPRNIFPVFTVGALTCKIGMFSGGEIACHGQLPGVTDGDDEVFVALPGSAGTRKAADPPFSSPNHPGDIRELPEGHRIDSHGGTCLSTGDGVACMGSVDGTWHGFVVTADDVRTF